MPLYVAGRVKERTLINKTLVRIAKLPKGKKRDQSLGPLAPIRIVGPRGVGKTTLLKEAWKMADEQGIHVVHVERLNSLAEEGLLAGLVGDSAYEKINAKLNRIQSVSAGPAGVSFREEKHSLVTSMDKIMKQKPLLLLLDEAMHYEKSAFGELLQLCQKLMAYNKPLAVIMAGTPKLNPLLEQVHASFIDRSKNIRINALSDEDVRDALAQPFALQDIKVAPAAIDYMTTLTDNYPFFIQIVGAQVWETMLNTGKKEVSLALVKKAQSEIKEQREEFYEFVHSKISRAELVPHSLRIIEILGMNDSKVRREVILSGLAGKPMGEYGKEQIEILDQLVDLGFVWEQGGSIEAGIPSFFSYCKQIAKEVQGGKA